MIKERMETMKNKKNVLSLAGGGGPAEPVLSKAWAGYRTTKNLNKTVSQLTKLRGPVDPGFTMAEILLSLTIIGVVAAITLPSLTGNINERTWNTQRKALYARFSQAIALMPALNGYGTLNAGNSSTSAVDTAAETFVTDGLAKVLKINNICDSEHLADCGIPSKLTNLQGNLIASFPLTFGDLNSAMINTSYTYCGVVHPYEQLNTKAAAFETVNGESIAVFYNPNCYSLNMEMTYWVQPTICANFVYDLNGSKGPNTVGKDIGFVTALYATDSSVVAPMPINRIVDAVPQTDALAACKGIDTESRFPNIDEMIAMFANRELIGYLNSYSYWTSTSCDNAALAKYLNMSRGEVSGDYKTNHKPIHCIKR